MISVAIQKGQYVYVYDDKNHMIRTIFGELYGFTSGSYSIKKSQYVYTYDEKGHLLSTNLLVNRFCLYNAFFTRFTEKGKELWCRGNRTKHFIKI